MLLIALPGQKTKQKLRETVSRFISKGSVPEQWRQGRMSLVYEGKGDRLVKVRKTKVSPAARFDSNASGLQVRTLPLKNYQKPM